MAIFVSKCKTLELESAGDKCFLKGAFLEDEQATMSAGRVKWEKGGGEKDYVYTYDEVMYVLKGSFTAESEGKTYAVHEGEVIHFTKGTKVTQRADEDVEILWVTFPNLRKIGVL